jgi:hypothetical protein
VRLATSQERFIAFYEAARVSTCSTSQSLLVGRLDFTNMTLVLVQVPPTAQPNRC